MQTKERVTTEPGWVRAAPVTQDAKILFLDIENTPNLAYVWDKYQQDVISFETEWSILCFGYKWKGDKQVLVEACPVDDPLWDYDVVSKLWELLDEADIIVTHNGVAFDIRKINARFAHWGFGPPSPYAVVDTKMTASKHFKFNSNSQKDLLKYLGAPAKFQKMDPGGFATWYGCMKSEPKAWATMVKYNKRDVEGLEWLYYRLRPWMDSHPNITLGAGIALRCPRCGSKKVERRGWTYLKSWRAQRFVCQSCGRWSKGAREKLSFQVLN